MKENPGYSGERRSSGGELCGAGGVARRPISPKGETSRGAAAHPRTSWRLGRPRPPRPHPDTTNQGVHGNRLDFLPDVHLLSIQGITRYNSFVQMATNI